MMLKDTCNLGARSVCRRVGDEDAPGSVMISISLRQRLVCAHNLLSIKYLPFTERVFPSIYIYICTGKHVTGGDTDWMTLLTGGQY